MLKKSITKIGKWALENRRKIIKKENTFFPKKNRKLERKVI